MGLDYICSAVSIGLERIDQSIWDLRVEVKVESVDDVIAEHVRSSSKSARDMFLRFLADNDDTAHSIIGFALGVGFHTLEPLRIRRNVVIGGQVDICSTKIVETVQVRKSQWRRGTDHILIIDLRGGVFDLRSDIRGVIWILGLYVNKRS